MTKFDSALLSTRAHDGKFLTVIYSLRSPAFFKLLKNWNNTERVAKPRSYILDDRFVAIVFGKVLYLLWLKCFVS